MDEKQNQENLKNARTSGYYDEIWKNTGKCVFCDLKDKYILHEENGVVLTINIYPYIDGQMMAIPRRHVMSVNELTQVEWETMRKFSYIAKKLFKKIHGRKAMWSLVKTGVLAQGTVADHLHMHYIPFDTQDLCVWNYRDLEYTPLENVELYKNDYKEFIESYVKFEKKYSHKSELPIVCGLLMINDKNEVLLQERNPRYKLYPDQLTIPGGHVDEPSKGLIESLKKEIKEETNYDFEVKDAELIDSVISKLDRLVYFDRLKKKGIKPSTSIWNIYLLKSYDKSQELVPGDDCEKLIWLPYSEVLSSDRIGQEAKDVIVKGYGMLRYKRD